MTDDDSGSRSLRAGAMSVALSLIAASWLASCGGDKKDTLDLVIDPESTPTMLTHNVSSLISDSGITRYHITAPIWYVFGEAMSPRWTFPKGIFLEKFDDNLQRDATVECDSAVYYEDRKLWRLDGNVRIMNLQDERFLTQQLFWDQRQQKVYSDSFIHIERSDRIIEGYGFTSNDRLTDYVVNRVSGIFPVSQFVGGASRDSLPVQDQSDSQQQRAASSQAILEQNRRELEQAEEQKRREKAHNDSVIAERRRRAHERQQQKRE